MERHPIPLIIAETQIKISEMLLLVREDVHYRKRKARNTKQNHQTITSVGKDKRNPRTLLGWGGVKWYLRRRQVLKKLNTDMSHDPTIPHLSVHRGRDDGVGTTVGTTSVMAAIFTTAPDGKRRECPGPGDG
mgnify:CR=1 FL=1